MVLSLTMMRLTYGRTCASLMGWIVNLIHAHTPPLAAFIPPTPHRTATPVNRRLRCADLCTVFCSNDAVRTFKSYPKLSSTRVPVDYRLSNHVDKLHIPDRNIADSLDVFRMSYVFRVGNFCPLHLVCLFYATQSLVGRLLLIVCFLQAHRWFAMGL